MKSLFKTVALITIFSFITRALGFVFRIILSREVGAEALGLYQVASSVFFVFLTIIASGLPLIISRMSSAYVANKENKKEASLVSVALIFALVLSIVLCLLVLIFRNLFASFFTDERCINVLIILLPSIIFSSVYCVLRGAMWGRGNYFALCVTELYEQIVRMVVALMLISSTYSAIENALKISISMSVSCLFSMLLVILLYFFYGGKLGKPSRELFRPLVRQSTPITLMRVSSSFVQPLIATIIPARLTAIGYTNSQALSLYGVAVGMTLPLLYIPTTLIGSLSTALVPDISSAVAQNNQKHVEERVGSSILFSLLISALFVPVFLGMGEQVGIFLYDNILSGTLLQSAACVLIPMGLTNITSALLNSLGYEKRSFVNFVIGGAAMFVCLIFLPAIIGINALVFGMGINYLIVSILNFRLLKKKTGFDLKIAKLILKLIAVVIPSAALTGFIVSLCEYVFPLFFTLVFGGISAVLSYILLCAVLGIIDIKTLYVEYGGKIKLTLGKIKLTKRGKAVK